MGPIFYETIELGRFYILSTGAMWYGLVWEEIASKNDSFLEKWPIFEKMSEMFARVFLSPLGDFELIWSPL